MATAYLALGLTAAVFNLVAALAGIRDGLAAEPSRPFWYLLRVAQVSTMLFAIYACVIYLTGHRAEDPLHYLYVLLPVAVSFLAELIRGSVAPHELGERLDPGVTGPPPPPAELSARFRALDPAQQRAIGIIIVRRETMIMTAACAVTCFLVWRALVTMAGLF